MSPLGEPSMELFRLAIEAAPTGMILVDAGGRIALINAETERIFGSPRAELIGAPVERLVPEGFGAGGARLGRRRDGTEVPIEIGLSLLATPAGDFVLGSVVDISERRRAEREREALLDHLRGFNAELEARVEARTAELTTMLKEREVLLQEVHHRVKNNLQVISSLINMQVRRLGQGPSRDALAECRTRVQAIALIHEQLYQSHDYARVPFSEYARLLAANVFAAVSAPHGPVTLDLAIDDLALAVDKAIPCGLVLNELITNALKHAFPRERPGTLRVELRRLGEGQLRLAVSDDGVGLAPGFDIHGAESLGLQLVCTLAEQLGATLEVRGAGGATFQLTFAAEV